MATATAIIGTAISAAGSLIGGITAANQSKYQAQVAENNAELARKNALEAGNAQQMELQAEGMRASELLAQQYAAQGGSGLKSNSVSSALLRERSQEVATQDFINIANAGANQVLGYMQQSTDLQNEAGAHKASASASLLSGFLSAGSVIAGAYNPSQAATFRKPVTTPTFRHTGLRPV